LSDEEVEKKTNQLQELGGFLVAIFLRKQDSATDSGASTEIISGNKDPPAE
jgi:hypothetical protein